MNFLWHFTIFQQILWGFFNFCWFLCLLQSDDPSHIDIDGIFLDNRKFTSFAILNIWINSCNLHFLLATSGKLKMHFNASLAIQNCNFISRDESTRVRVLKFSTIMQFLRFSPLVPHQPRLDGVGEFQDSFLDTNKIKSRLYFTIWLPRETWISFSVDASVFCVSNFMKKFVYTWNNPQIKCRLFALHLVAFFAYTNTGRPSRSTSVGRNQISADSFSSSSNSSSFPTSTDVGYEISNSNSHQIEWKVRRGLGIVVLHCNIIKLLCFMLFHVIVFELGNRQRLHKFGELKVKLSHPTVDSSLTNKVETIHWNKK